MAGSAQEELIVSLFEAGCVKFGSFKLKSGIMSPVYFDLRVIVSYPKLMSTVSDFLWSEVQDLHSVIQSVCGVPYTALPLATLIAAKWDVPMLMRRKEAKDYGTKKMIEGKTVAGSSCLIVEDVVTSGGSVLETAVALEEAGLKVTDAVVLLDREQGGRGNLEGRGIRLHSVLTITDVVTTLEKLNKITSQTVEDVISFIKTTPTAPPPTAQPHSKVVRISFEQRMEQASHPVAKQLFKIMVDKSSNLCLSADVTTMQELLQLCDKVGPHVCMVKTHVDIVGDFDRKGWKELRELAAKHNFVIMEDRKFADIGSTVKHQVGAGVFAVAEWADLVTVHAIPGAGILQALREACQSRTRPLGCVLVAEMTSEGNLITEEYTKSVVSMATEYRDIVAGLVCVKRVTDEPGLVLMTPGVQLSAGGDSLGQTYNTPQEVLGVRGSDVIIVGRGIYQAPDVVDMAVKYKMAGCSAILDRLK